jgi:hypothetical protein
MATKYFIGRATPFPEIVEFDFGGTWASNDTVTITIGGDDIVVTVDTQTTGEEVADAVFASLSGAAATGGESVNFQQSAVPALLASAHDQPQPTRVRIIGQAGVPLSMAGVKVSSSGTLTTTTVQSATGANHCDAADNYIGGLPASGDTVILDTPGVAMLYAASALNDVAKFEIRTGAFGSDESPILLSDNCIVEVGTHGSTTLALPTKVAIDAAGNDVDLTVFGSPIVTDGSVTAAVRVSNIGGGSAVVYDGEAEVRGTTIGAQTVFGGRLTSELVASTGDVTVRGGTLIKRFPMSTATLRQYGGTIWDYSGTKGSQKPRIYGGTYELQTNDGVSGIGLYGGLLQMNKSPVALTISRIEAFGGVINDPLGRSIGVAIDCNGDVDTSEWDLGGHVTITTSANAGGVS